MGKCDEGGNQDGGAGYGDHPFFPVELPQDLHAEDVGIDPVDAEDSDLYHGHRMEEGRNRRGRYHGPGKPRMKRHDPRLGETEGEKEQKDDLGGRAEGSDLPDVAQEVHRDLSSVQPGVAPA